MIRDSHHVKIGDGTNFVAVLGGEFLHQAEDLLQTGLHTSEIISGYEKAGKKALEILEGKGLLGRGLNFVNVKTNTPF